MEPKPKSVKGFFETPQIYLSNNINIEIRSTIVRQMLGSVHGLRMLDIGCGDGSVSLQFLRDLSKLTLLDISFNMLTIAKSRVPSSCQRQVQYLNADFHQVMPTEQYDIVLCIGVLAHLPSINESLLTISKFVRPGGKLLLQYTDAETQVGRFLLVYERTRRQLGMTGRKYSVNRITHFDVTGAVDALDFRVVKERRYWPLLPGTRRLPFDLAKKMMLKTANTKCLAKYGAESLLILRKDARINGLE